MARWNPFFVRLGIALLWAAAIVFLDGPPASADQGGDASPASGPAKVKIVLAGDSTVNAGGGWGPGFAKRLKPGVECVNLARSGRSSKSYRAEGHWKAVLEQRPDYVLIQFGHNDMPGKGPARETDPNTTYAENMARYVDEAPRRRWRQAHPDHLDDARRRFTPQDKIQSDLVPYVEAVKKVAAAKKVPLLDLHARGLEYLDRIGPGAAAKLDHPTKDPAKPDHTHLSDKGSDVMGRLVAEELKRVVPEFRPYLLDDTRGASPVSGTDP